jgi:hypothetical protein
MEARVEPNRDTRRRKGYKHRVESSYLSLARMDHSRNKLETVEGRTYSQCTLELSRESSSVVLNLFEVGEHF